MEEIQLSIEGGTTQEDIDSISDQPQRLLDTFKYIHDPHPKDKDQHSRIAPSTNINPIPSPMFHSPAPTPESHIFLQA